jgi:nucleotide-binding universal stress UspA family protein
VINIIGEEKWHALRSQKEGELLDAIKSRLKNFCEDVRSELPSCNFITDDIIVKIGSPVEEILLQVQNGDFDIVVMGAHGHGILTTALIGSVSRRVVRRCKKPVLVVRLPEE